MSLRRAKPVANSKTKTMPSPSKISVVIISGKEVTVTLHRRARMSPAKKQETPPEQWPPTATPGRAEDPPGQKGDGSQGDDERKEGQGGPCEEDSEEEEGG